MKKLFTLILLAFVFNCFSPVAEAAGAPKIIVVKAHKKHHRHHRHRHHRHHHHHRRVIILKHA